MPGDTAVCRSCRAPIRWVHTAATGAPMPLDAEPDPAGNIELADGTAIVHANGQTDLFGTGTRWMPHHATCPHANEWRT